MEYVGVRRKMTFAKLAKCTETGKKTEADQRAFVDAEHGSGNTESGKAKRDWG